MDAPDRCGNGRLAQRSRGERRKHRSHRSALSLPWAPSVRRWQRQRLRFSRNDRVHERYGVAHGRAVDGAFVRPGQQHGPKILGSANAPANREGDKDFIGHADIDLFDLSWKELSKLPADEIKKKFFCEADFTHTNEAGAILNASKVAGAIKLLPGCKLADFLKP